MKILQQEDFKWEELYANNMPQNGIEGYYALVPTGCDSARLYIIRFQREVDENGVGREDSDIELYILFETSYTDIVGPVTIPAPTTDDGFCEGVNTFNHCTVNSSDGFVRAFKTLEEAKVQAYRQYFFVYGYAMSFIEDRDDEI